MTNDEVTEARQAINNALRRGVIDADFIVQETLKIARKSWAKGFIVGSVFTTGMILGIHLIGWI